MQSARREQLRDAGKHDRARTVIVLRRRRRSEFRECRDRRGAGRRRTRARQLRLTVLDIIRWWHARGTPNHAPDDVYVMCFSSSVSLSSVYRYLIQYRKKEKRERERAKGKVTQGEVWEKGKERRTCRRVKRGSPWGSPLKITSYTLFQTDHLR